ncbi:MAG: phosphatase PAP2 family protein [Actinomycetota bacterium]|nr:phosphatase PAP2 family protein [Actinomycetota bacterium]
MTIAVLLTAVAAGVVAATVSISRHIRVDPIDPANEEAWMVDHARRSPHLVGFLRRRVDPRRTAGLMLTVHFAVVLACALVVGLVLDMIDENVGIARFDERISRWGVEHASEGAIEVLRAVTRFGDTEVVFTVLGAVALYYVVVRRNVEVAAFLATTGIGIVALNNLLKILVDRDRPTVGQLVGHWGPAFPSGHSATAAACWAAVALVLSRGRSRTVQGLLAGAAALIAAGVGASRALLGVHWLTDVVAGLVVGWGWFIVVAVAFGGRRQHFGDPIERILDALPDRLTPTPARRDTNPA